MATAKKAAKKKAAKKNTSKDVTTKNFKKLVGTDPRNGIVTLEKFSNGFTLTNSRTGKEEFIKTQTKAIDAYEAEINNSHKD